MFRPFKVNKTFTLPVVSGWSCGCCVSLFRAGQCTPSPVSHRRFQSVLRLMSPSHSISWSHQTFTSTRNLTTFRSCGSRSDKLYCSLIYCNFKPPGYFNYRNCTKRRATMVKTRITNFKQKPIFQTTRLTFEQSSEWKEQRGGFYYGSLFPPSDGR